MSEPISEERLRNTRAWAAARLGQLSGAEVIVGAIDELLERRRLDRPHPVDVLKQIAQQSGLEFEQESEARMRAIFDAPVTLHYTEVTAEQLGRLQDALHLDREHIQSGAQELPPPHFRQAAADILRAAGVTNFEAGGFMLITAAGLPPCLRYAVAVESRLVSTSAGTAAAPLAPLDLQPGDIIQRKGTDVWFNVEYVFPDKVVIKQTVDVMASELGGWEKVRDYGRTVGAKRTPQG